MKDSGTKTRENKVDRTLRKLGCYREDGSNGRYNVVRVCAEDKRRDEVLHSNKDLWEIELLIAKGKI